MGHKLVVLGCTADFVNRELSKKNPIKQATAFLNMVEKHNVVIIKDYMILHDKKEI